MTKPLCRFLSAWKTIPRISCWLLGIIEREYALKFRRRPPCFNGVAQISGPSTERSASVRPYRWHRFAPETGCVWGFKGCVLSHSDSTASQALSEVCSRGHSVPVPPVLLFELALAPHTFSKCMDAALFPPSERAGCAFSIIWMTGWS